MAILHYTEVSQRIIDDLLNMDEELGCTKNSNATYRKLDENLMPTEETSDCKMGHTLQQHVSREGRRKAIALFDEILEPIVGYKPNTNGRYGFYKQPIHIHNDGQNMLGGDFVWRDHNKTGVIPKPANTTVFFPLRVYKEDGSPGTTETIYFNQRTPWYKKSGKVAVSTSEEFYRKHGAMGWYEGHDYSELDGWTGTAFDSAIHEKYLKQHSIDRLFGFSFAASVPWNIGEVVMFETSRIHCSSFMEDCFGKDCFLIKCNTELFE